MDLRSDLQRWIEQAGGTEVVVEDVGQFRRRFTWRDGPTHDEIAPLAEGYRNAGGEVELVRRVVLP